MVDLDKKFVDDKGEMLAWGDEVHKAMAGALSAGRALPITMQRYQPWIDLLDKQTGSGKCRTEMKLSFDRNFKACGYFDGQCWFRGVADVLILRPPVAVAIDWKTGKILVDSQQLGLMAQCVFANYPDIDTVATSFIWLGQDTQTPEVYRRPDMTKLWSEMMPRVQAMEEAYKSGVYHPIPSGLCKRFCPVETCQYHGRGAY
jgi:hypothetical protein